MKYRFRPRLLPTVATLLLALLFVRLGLWQLHKAEAKQALQAQFDRYLHETPVTLPAQIDNAEDWRYRHVKVTGSYETQYQILLDNQVENGDAGYHVITPLHIEGADRYILVDRGWIPAPSQHSDIPPVVTPEGVQQLSGNLWLPSTKIFTLGEPPADGKWQPVWQNMDMQRYLKSVPLKLYPLVIRLDPDSKAGGFVRNWPHPAERIETNLGYAYQWFGFAVTLVAIYLVLTFRRSARE